MAGCGFLISSLRALERVQVYGGFEGQFDLQSLCAVLRAELDESADIAGAQVEVTGILYGFESDGEEEQGE